MISPQWLELPMFRTNFHGYKDVRAIEVRLYVVFTKKENKYYGIQTQSFRVNFHRVNNKGVSSQASTAQAVQSLIIHLLENMFICICDTNMAFKHISLLWSATVVIMGHVAQKPILPGHVGDTAFFFFFFCPDKKKKKKKKKKTTKKNNKKTKQKKKTKKKNNNNKKKKKKTKQKKNQKNISPHSEYSAVLPLTVLFYSVKTLSQILDCILTHFFLLRFESGTIFPLM